MSSTVASGSCTSTFVQWLLPRKLERPLDPLTEKVYRKGAHADETRNDGRQETRVENVRVCVFLRGWRRQGAFNEIAFLGGY